MGHTGVAVNARARVHRAVAICLVTLLMASLAGPLASLAMIPIGPGPGAPPVPTPTATPTPAPTATQQPQTGWSDSYSVYRKRTFAVQVNDFTCVAASVQMMLNTINGTHNHSTRQQKNIWHYAQANSYYPVSDNGADVGGWVAALEHWGAGKYYFDVSSSMAIALRHAATQMRLTGKPVGIIVWGTHGGHAWVMTGFTSDRDPRSGGNFNVTSIQAMGPLWPLGTIDLHPYDPGPKTWVGMAELTRKFTAYYAPKSPEWVGKWLTVLPA
jgi:hypothetical protein